MGALTVVPAATEANLPINQKSLFTVSAVVCYKRQTNDKGETSGGVTFLGNNGWGGGSIKIDLPDWVRENHWIMLCGGSQCKWYRIATIGDGYASLSGPDWDVTASPSPTAVIVKTVVGVYTKQMVLDRDPAWYPQQQQP